MFLHLMNLHVILQPLNIIEDCHYGVPNQHTIPFSSGLGHPSQYPMCAGYYQSQIADVLAHCEATQQRQNVVLEAGIPSSSPTNHY